MRIDTLSVTLAGAGLIVTILLLLAVIEYEEESQVQQIEKHTYEIFINDRVFHSDTLASHDDYWYIEDEHGRGIFLGKCFSIIKEDSTNYFTQ